MHAAELQTVPNGIVGYEAVVAQAYFPMQLGSAGDASGFQARAASARIGPALLTRLYATGRYWGRVDARRGQRGAPFVLNLCEEGGCAFRGTREATTRPGDLILIDPSRSFEVFQAGSGQSLAIVIPAAVLASHCDRPEDLALRSIDTTVGVPAILRETLLGCWRQRGSVAPAVAPELLGAIAQLVAASFRETARGGSAGSLSAHHHLLRIRELVTQHLSSTSLSADFVAERLGMSKSHVFALMKGAGTTLGRFILEQRLERARRLLVIPARGSRSISDVAYAVGFRELSHFSRRFAERFGLPPRAYRARSLHEEAAGTPSGG